MKTFVRLEIFREREHRGETLLYTVRLSADGEAWNDETETDDFIRYFEEREKGHGEEFDQLLKLLELIALRGARSAYFRPEQGAHALPRPTRIGDEIIVSSGNSVRLYCVRWSEKIVVLLNGGIKTRNVAQDCPNVAKYFALAIRIANRLDRMLSEGELSIADDTFSWPDRGPLIFEI